MNDHIPNEFLAHQALAEFTENHRWMSTPVSGLLEAMEKASAWLRTHPDFEAMENVTVVDMVLPPNPYRALHALNEADVHEAMNTGHTSQLFMAMASAAAWLRGYKLPQPILDQYHCTQCGKKGVKLWRAVHSARESWCSACAMAQAGWEDTINEEGRNFMTDEHVGSDQIYNDEQGQNLLPWVIAPDGETWGYTSVPGEGCLWWKHLPTR